jgi:hypothetical protein
MLLVTFAVPPPGTHFGGAVSLAIASPPWVAIAIAKPAIVVQLAVATAPCSADASAEQFEADEVALAELPVSAVAVAKLPSFPSASALLPFSAFALLEP